MVKKRKQVQDVTGNTRIRTCFTILISKGLWHYHVYVSADPAAVRLPHIDIEAA